MQGKPPVFVDDGMACIGAALKPDDNIGVLRQQVGNLPLALVAPASAYNRFNQFDSLLCVVDKHEHNNVLIQFYYKGCPLFCKIMIFDV